MAEADVLPVDRAQAELAGEDDVDARVGDRLRAARERLGLGRDELSLRTKINPRHLEALEDSDFEALPARIYAVGFARSYAGAVGLDAARIAAEVRRELSERENPPARPAHQLDIDDPAKVPSRRLVWLSLALAALLIAAGVMLWRSYFVPAVDLPPVRDDVALTPPELSPQAQISPTAESAVPLVPEATTATSGATTNATNAAPASQPAPVARRAAPAPTPRSVAPAAAPPPPAQSLPAPQPEVLEPAPAADPARQPG